MPNSGKPTRAPSSRVSTSSNISPKAAFPQDHGMCPWRFTDPFPKGWFLVFAEESPEAHTHQWQEIPFQQGTKWTCIMNEGKSLKG